MEQLRIETTEKITSCAFTGHRRLGEDFDPERLKKEIESCVSRGVSLFYCGMAAGFDLYAAECVVELKRKLPFLRLAACIPCDGQEKYFSFEEKKPITINAMHWIFMPHLLVGQESLICPVP